MIENEKLQKAIEIAWSELTDDEREHYLFIAEQMLKEDA
jgi:hypothetical protein